MAEIPHKQAKDFGDYIARRRRELRLSQEGLAQRAGLSQALIAQMERLITDNPNFETLCKLSTGLGVAPTDLLVVHQSFEKRCAAATSVGVSERPE